MKVRRNQKSNAAEFQIIVELNIGELFFTIDAATKLRNELSNVLAVLKKEASNETRSDNV